MAKKPSRPPAGISWASFEIFYEGDSKEVSNTYWYSVTAGAISATTNFATVTNAFATLVLNAFSGIVSNEVRFHGVRGIFNNGAGSVGYDDYLTSTGGDENPPLPMDTAIVVQKETADFSRAGRGRWYLAGVGVDQVDGSYLTNGGVAAVQAFAVAAKTEIVSGSLSLSPAHYVHSTRALEPIVNTPVVSLIATARHRKNRF